MLSNLFLTTTLLLSLVNTTFAQRNVWSKTANGVGGSIILKDNAPKETGFAATFYDYPLLNFIPFWDDSFVAGEYSSNAIRTTANSVTEPNFEFTNNLLSEQIYGLYNMNMLNVLVELKGYYVRMYI